MTKSVRTTRSTTKLRRWMLLHRMLASLRVKTAGSASKARTDAHLLDCSRGCIVGECHPIRTCPLSLSPLRPRSLSFLSCFPNCLLRCLYSLTCSYYIAAHSTGPARNASSPCWINCFYDTVLGPDAGLPGGQVAGMPLQDLITAWDLPFASSDPSQGGCPALQPQ